MDLVFPICSADPTTFEDEVEPLTCVLDHQELLTYLYYKWSVVHTTAWILGSSPFSFFETLCPVGCTRSLLYTGFFLVAMSGVTFPCGALAFIAEHRF